MTELEAIRPQPGPQEMVLSTPADIAIYGGQAGGGKTWALLVEPLRHIDNPGFAAVIFRRTSAQVRNPGGLWDEASRLYPLLGGRPKSSKLEWVFPSGAVVRFAHLEHEANRFDWQGAQIPFIGFDELTHFSASQFFYLLSRNRSLSGVSPYIRATCNPDPDSFVAELIRWWIDARTGFASVSRAGVVRWFVRTGDHLDFAATPSELLTRHGSSVRPKSVTFIPASVHDNQILLSKDPGYLANLEALPRVERARLLQGNWKIRAHSGSYFRQRELPIRDTPLPETDVRARVRAWDLAATREDEGGDPDYSVGVRMALLRDGRYVVEHVCRFRGSPGEVMSAITSYAQADGRAVRIVLPQDPGQAGKAQAASMVGQLAGYDVRLERPTGSKETRAGPLSAQAESGNVALLSGPWAAAFIDELEAFPDARHDDQVDAVSSAFHALADRARKGSPKTINLSGV